MQLPNRSHHCQQPSPVQRRDSTNSRTMLAAQAITTTTTTTTTMNRGDSSKPPPLKMARTNNSPSSSAKMQCFKCGNVGHEAWQCVGVVPPQPQKPRYHALPSAAQAKAAQRSTHSLSNSKVAQRDNKRKLGYARKQDDPTGQTRLVWKKIRTG